MYTLYLTPAKDYMVLLQNFNNIRITRECGINRITSECCITGKLICNYLFVIWRIYTHGQCLMI